MGKRIHEVRKNYIKNTLYVKPSISSEIKDLIKQMMENDKYKRISIEKILGSELIHEEYLSLLIQFFPKNKNPLPPNQAKKITSSTQIKQSYHFQKIEPEDMSPILKLYKPKHNFEEIKNKHPNWPFALNHTIVSDEFILKEKKNSFASPFRPVSKSGIQSPKVNFGHIRIKNRNSSRTRKITITNNYSPKLYDLNSQKQSNRIQEKTNRVRYLSNDKTPIVTKMAPKQILSEVKHHSGLTTRDGSRPPTNKKVEILGSSKNNNLVIYEHRSPVVRKLQFNRDPKSLKVVKNLHQNKKIKSKKDGPLNRKMFSSQSTLLKFEDHTFHTMDASMDPKPVSLINIDSSPVKKKQEISLISKQQIKSDFNFQKKERINRMQRQETSDIDNSPDIYSPERISSYLKLKSAVPFQNIKRRKFKSILKREKSVSLSDQVKLAQKEKLEKIKLKIDRKSEMSNFRKVFPTNTFFTKKELKEEATQKLNLNHILEKNQMTKTIKKFYNSRKKVQKITENKNNENLRQNGLCIEEGDKNRLEEFRRMRSPKKKSLFEEYKEKMQGNAKPISLNTYYKIPQNSSFLRKKRRRRKNK